MAAPDLPCTNPRRLVWEGHGRTDVYLRCAHKLHSAPAADASQMGSSPFRSLI